MLKKTTTTKHTVLGNVYEVNFSYIKNSIQSSQATVWMFWIVLMLGRARGI